MLSSPTYLPNSVKTISNKVFKASLHLFSSNPTQNFFLDKNRENCMSIELIIVIKQLL